jgi:manganese efflux pump family protein
MPILPLLLFILPLGLDTLGVSISLGIKSRRNEILEGERGASRLPAWLSSAILFSLAETVMPLAGLAIGYATSLLISNIMHVLGPLLLIGVGVWELQEEALEYIKKKKGSKYSASGYNAPSPTNERFQWRRQLLLAISISLDELAIGFSLGTITVNHSSGKPVNPIALCILIGIQGFLMTLIGIALGRTLRTRLKTLKEWTELLSAFLLIGLGIWLLFT